MKVIGKGGIRFIDPVDELPHVPGADPYWQESVVLYVWDTRQQCYVFLRVSHEPHNGPEGTAVVWSNVWVPGFQYKYTDAKPLRPEDRFVEGLGAPTVRYRYDGAHHWTLQADELELALVMRDAHPAFDFFVDQNLGAIAPNHIEASGTVSGQIRFRDQTYTLSGAVGHRDHSWGLRKWATIRSHRWLPAIFGPDFSLNAMSYLGEGGELRQFGFVIRDDTLIVPEQVSVCVQVEADGQTTRGALVNFALPGGEDLEVIYRHLAPSAISFHQVYPCNDAMAAVRCGDRVGVGVVESGGNPTGGRERPQQRNLVCGYIDNGVFPIMPGDCRVPR